MEASSESFLRVTAGILPGVEVPGVGGVNHTCSLEESPCYYHISQLAEDIKADPSSLEIKRCQEVDNSTGGIFEHCDMIIGQFVGK